MSLFILPQVSVFQVFLYMIQQCLDLPKLTTISIERSAFYEVSSLTISGLFSVSFLIIRSSQSNIVYSW